MSLRGALAALGLLVASGSSALANPCAAARVDGRNVFADGAQKAIRIAKERITIGVDVGVDKAKATWFKKKRFRVDYVFENNGPAKELVVGFPIIAPAENEKAKGVLERFDVKGRGVRRRVKPVAGRITRYTDAALLHLCEGAALKDLKKSLAGPRRVATTRFEKEGVRFVHAKDEPYRLGWYFWRQRFARGKSRVTVSYTFRRGTGICAVSYLLRTARYWGDGRIGELTVDLDVRPPRARADLDTTLIEMATEGRTRPGHETKKALAPQKVGRGRLRWRARKHDAQRDLVFRLKSCEEG